MGFLDKIGEVFSRRVDFDISESQTFSIGDLPTLTTPIPTEKYICHYVDKEKGRLTLGVCILKDSDFIYKKDNKISISYEEFRKTHVFTGKIDYISERRDIFNEDEEKEYFKGVVDDEMLQKYELLFITVLLTSLPISYDRRDYIRHYSPSWTIYFKIIDNENEGISYTDSLNNVYHMSLAQLQLMESGKFTTENEYCVLKTLDISAGGFRSKVETQIPVGAELECIILIENEKFPVKGEVLECSLDSQSTQYLQLYQIRVQFTDISEITQNAILKYIIVEERKVRRRFKS